MPISSVDGDYTSPQRSGQTEYDMPFATDPKPYVYKIPFWQYYANYASTVPTLGDAGPDGGYFVGDVPGSIKPVGAGIVEFMRQYAFEPDTRSEPESFVYSYPIILVGDSGGITEMPVTTHSRVQFDYFQTSDPTTITLTKAPKAFQLLNTIYLLNNLGDYVCPPGEPTNTEILAQDATLKVWKPGIYERQQRYVRWISVDDLFANAGCP